MIDTHDNPVRGRFKTEGLPKVDCGDCLSRALLLSRLRSEHMSKLRLRSKHHALLCHLKLRLG